MRLARLDPARVPLRLAQCFQHVRLDPVLVDGPRADERLPEQVVLLRIVERAPATDERVPLARELGEDADACADVAAALRVVRLRRQQVAGKARGALDVGAVEIVDRQPEAVRVAADLVQRGQPHVPVERRVLDTLRHHRTGRLLPARHELVVATLLEEDHAA